MNGGLRYERCSVRKTGSGNGDAGKDGVGLSERVLAAADDVPKRELLGKGEVIVQTVREAI